MKKKLIIITILISIIIFLYIGILMNSQSSLIKNENTNMIKQETNLQIEQSNITKNDVIEEKIEKNNELENDTTYSNINQNSWPNDFGLTISGESKTFDQDIMSKANIAYLLGCDNITDDTDFEDYINKHLPQNGIFISERSIYKKDLNNPYDFLMARKDFMKKMLSEINLSYKINENNYLIDNMGNSSLEQKLNKVINGNKKIIIGFVAEYYEYINDTDYGVHLGGIYRKSYVSFKPFNNIYPYIFDENSADIDDFHEMIEEIANLSE